MTPTEALTAAQFAEHFRRMMWGVMRLERIGDEAVKEQMRSIGDILTRRIGIGWREMVTAKDVRRIGSMLSSAANPRDGGSPELLKQLYTTVMAGLDYGNTVVRADVDFQLAIATAQMDFWARAAELANLPADALVRIVSGAASVASATLGAAGNILKGPLIIIGLAVLALATVGKELFGKKGA